MSKFLLTSSILVMGLATAQSASAADVETKLIFNSDTGVESSISQNPKVVAESATAATKPVLKAAGMQNNSTVGARVGTTAQADTNLQAGTTVGTNARTPQPVLNSSLADSVPDEEQALEENAGAVAKGEAYSRNGMSAGVNTTAGADTQMSDPGYVDPNTSATIDPDARVGVNTDARVGNTQTGMNSGVNADARLNSNVNTQNGALAGTNNVTAETGMQNNVSSATSSRVNVE